MPLSRGDIDRISDLGYRDFVDNTGNWPSLLNIDGKCFFLKDGKCRIYTDRPEGCRLYPIIINNEGTQIGIDDDCPYPDEFSVTEVHVSILLALIDKLETEKTSK